MLILFIVLTIKAPEWHKYISTRTNLFYTVRFSDVFGSTDWVNQRLLLKFLGNFDVLLEGLLVHTRIKSTSMQNSLDLKPSVIKHFWKMVYSGLSTWFNKFQCMYNDPQDVYLVHREFFFFFAWNFGICQTKWTHRFFSPNVSIDSRDGGRRLYSANIAFLVLWSIESRQFLWNGSLE